MEKYKFSVVMAVYNVELFLREAIESLVEQDIGFENIQLILVDDGSKDSSGAICDEYAAKYPDNVLALHKENGGVTTARNEGLAHAEGKYLSFMDSDDKFTPNTFRLVYDFFEENFQKIDIVSVPIIFFDGGSGQHMLNYKYKKGSRVIDLDTEWDKPQLSIASAFVKKEAFEEFSFDTRLTYAEDAQLIQKILIKKCKLGVVSSCKYLYRRRSAGESSAIQNSGNTKEWYLPCIEYFHYDVMAYCKQTIGYLPLFVQYALMYDLQWKIKQENIPNGVLTEEEQKCYKELIAKELLAIDDSVIMAQKNIWGEHKLYALGQKYQCRPIVEKRAENIVFRFGEAIRVKLSSCVPYFDFLKIQDGRCRVEGHISIYDFDYTTFDICLNVDDTLCHCKFHEVENKSKTALGEIVLKYYSFEAEFPLDQETHAVKLVLVVDEVQVLLNNLRTGYYFPLSMEYKHAHYGVDEWNVSIIGKTLKFEKTGLVGWKKKEKLFIKELWKKRTEGARKAVFARQVWKVLKGIKKKEIWLISDRATRADDNGEALYIYMRKAHPEINSYFVIDDGCTDYQRIRKIGPVLKRNSFTHKILSLLSDYIISSQAEYEVRDPFYGHSGPYRDILMNNKFVFLQHGVIKDDLSGWLVRQKKNFYGFITSANPEYESVVNGNYDYTDKEIWLTGLPRFDRLYHDEKKQIAIMPTWRKYLMKSWDAETDLWTLKENFDQSEYVKFYSGLLSHPRLIEATKRYGYQLAFLPHPTLQKHEEYFAHDESVKILGPETSYREVYAHSNLVLTDYSSAVFDFLYLRKPIVYMHFDAEEFFAGEHVYTKGYFDYERDGFGEVEYDLESTVNRIIEYMENGCELKEKYRERIDKFFAFSDQNNCKRIYDRIMQLEKEN